MDGLTFLTKDIIEIPTSRSNQDLCTFLNELFSNYRSSLDLVVAGDPFSDLLVCARPQVGRLCDSILKAVRFYYEGFPARAYDEIAEVLDKEEFQTEMGNIHEIDEINNNLSYLYRLRTISEQGQQFTQRDLFHIPFEQRHKVATQRFSIPGLPCLYLGGSVYACWEELDRPDFNRVYMARFKAKEASKPKVLNLGYRPQYWRWRQSAEPNFWSNAALVRALASTLVLWPLMAACHIRVSVRSASFKPEYIVPQIVLQWVRSSRGLDGVAYSSARINMSFYLPMGQMNFVFPARDVQPTGYCPILKNQFEMSQPLSWQLCKAVLPPPRRGPLPPNVDL